MVQKPFKYPDVSFMMNEIWPKYASEHPDAAALCYPRRIVPPYGYLNPKVYACEMLCFLKQNAMVAEHQDTSMAWCGMVAQLLLEYEVPTYFIDEDFLRAVYESDPPDCRICDIQWPMPAMLFVLPMKFMQELTGGYHFPFLAVVNGPPGIYQIKHPKLMSLQCPARSINDKNRFIFHFPGFFQAPVDTGRTEDMVPVDYVASYEMTRHITELATFDDFIDWTGNYPNELIPVGQPDRAAEVLINKKINSLAAKLLLSITACPNAIERGPRLWPKTAPKPGQKLDKPELHGPNFIGRKYTVSRPSNGESEPTGRVMPTHWRRGHFQWTVVGPKSQVYSVANMPRNNLGQIDWPQCTEGQIKIFKETHKIDWIAKLRINAEEEKK
jgi:hypothetical protein